LALLPRGAKRGAEIFTFNFRDMPETALALVLVGHQSLLSVPIDVVKCVDTFTGTLETRN
jgi:hypothetical protein